MFYSFLTSINNGYIYGWFHVGISSKFNVEKPTVKGNSRVTDVFVFTVPTSLPPMCSRIAVLKKKVPTVLVVMSILG